MCRMTHRRRLKCLLVLLAGTIISSVALLTYIIEPFKKDIFYLDIKRLQDTDKSLFRKSLKLPQIMFSNRKVSRQALLLKNSAPFVSEPYLVPDPLVGRRGSGVTAKEGYHTDNKSTKTLVNEYVHKDRLLHFKRQKEKKLERQTRITNSNVKIRVVAKDTRSPSGWKASPNPGEGGVPVHVNKTQLDPKQFHSYRNGLAQHSFNEFVSSLISLHRSLPDPRDEECRHVQYLPKLPGAGVVIIFHNEAWSTLLRTVHSVLDRSPPDLLEQIVLVDDFSRLDHLKKPLEDYLQKLDKVKLVRMKEREGLIRARLVGLSHVNSSVVIFLDSHCECAEGWLEPLLDRIAKNSTTVVVPVIDVIDDTTFQYHFQSARNTNVGGFTWSLLFNWFPMPDREKRRRKSDIDPIRSPTMAGGLFAIDRAFFYKLGTYDPGMKIWGGENLELSFKTWMCGGTLETLPCSHVGHVFRRSSPYSFPGNALDINLSRLAAVWLDDYVIYFKRTLTRHGELLATDYGDVSDRIELRRQLKCQSFAWFLENITPEMKVPADMYTHGEIRNEHFNVCISGTDGPVHLSSCQSSKRVGAMSVWSMNIDSFEVQRDNKCLDYVPMDLQVKVVMCHGQGGHQNWKYTPELKQLKHASSKWCPEVTSKNPRLLVMAPCDPSNVRQHWLWKLNSVSGPSWRRDKVANRKPLR